MSGRVVGLVVALLVHLPAVSVPSTQESVGASSTGGPLRILVLGDSVSQGAAGDWTWR